MAPRTRRGTARRHLAWLAAGLVMGFAVPFVFADVLQLPRDLYYGIYIAAVLLLFLSWARATGQRFNGMVRRRWRLAVVLGLVFALLLSFVVVRTEPATPGPEGLALAWAVLWRGSPTAPPMACCCRRFRSWWSSLPPRAADCADVRPARSPSARPPCSPSLVMTTVYHLGYRDFRSPMLARPVTADIVWSVPTLVTLNPIGTPITHAALHVTAVLHSSDTDVFLPPHR
jgi:hypothetical protein